MKAYLCIEMAEMSHEVLTGTTHYTDTGVCLLAPTFYQMAFERTVRVRMRERTTKNL